jgi:hypothetical protein
MKKTIWKFAFEIGDEIVIEMPKGAEILTVQVQSGLAFIWALVDPGAEKENRYFDLYGTGHLIDMSIERWYIGTFQLYQGALVFHLFGRIK